MQEARAFAPATIANLSVGFDTLGMAIKSMGDEVILRENGTDKTQITKIIGGDGLSLKMEENCAGVVVLEMQKAHGDSKGLDIEIIKGLPVGSGLGSSSASAAAAALAYNQLRNGGYNLQELTHFAAMGEAVASGAIHLDNVAPAIFQQLVLIDSQMHIWSLPVPENLCLLYCWQKVEIKTNQARKMLPKEIPMGLARKQWASMGIFVSGLYESDYEKIKAGMIDFIAEPYRKKLIPFYEELNQINLDLGAVNFGISGSGPTTYAWYRNPEDAAAAKNAIHQFLNDKGQDFTCEWELIT